MAHTQSFLLRSNSEALTSKLALTSASGKRCPHPENDCVRFEYLCLYIEAVVAVMTNTPVRYEVEINLFLSLTQSIVHHVMRL